MLEPTQEEIDAARKRNHSHMVENPDFDRDYPYDQPYWHDPTDRIDSLPPVLSEPFLAAVLPHPLDEKKSTMTRAEFWAKVSA